YPVVDKHGQLVSTSVTNLDIHDISRTARTCDLDGYFTVTPVEPQHWLIGTILNHRNTGSRSTYNENRKDALALTHAKSDIGQVIDHVKNDTGEHPIFVVTSARTYPNTVTFATLRQTLSTPGPPVVLLFGTGWGLHPELIAEA